MTVRQAKWLRRRACTLYRWLDWAYDSVDCSGTLLEYMNPAIKRKRKKLMAMCRLLERFDRQQKKRYQQTGVLG
jgi:hypothetical protein